MNSEILNLKDIYKPYRYIYKGKALIMMSTLGNIVIKEDKNDIKTPVKKEEENKKGDEKIKKEKQENQVKSPEEKKKDDGNIIKPSQENKEENKKENGNIKEESKKVNKVK